MALEGLTTRVYHPGDQEAVIALWRACNLVFPWNDPYQDIARKLAQQPELFLVGTLENTVIATVMAGYEGHRGWINYLAVAPEHRFRGIGRTMMQAAEDRLRAIGCPKINLQVRAHNAEVLAFYQHLGFQIDQVVSLGKRLVEDRER